MPQPRWGGSPGLEFPACIQTGLSHIHVAVLRLRRAGTSGMSKGVYLVASAVLNIAPEGNLSRYLQEIRKFPMRTPEEELALAHQWRDSQDMEAAHKLVTSHLRLVAKIAMGYR